MAGLAIAVGSPGIASADLLSDAVDEASGTLEETVNDLTGAGESPAAPGGGGGGAPAAAPAPQAGAPPDYQPPMHGTNPHGQGTVAVADITPEDVAPLPYDEEGGSEDIVVG